MTSECLSTLHLPNELIYHILEVSWLLRRLPLQRQYDFVSCSLVSSQWQAAIEEIAERNVFMVLLGHLTRCFPPRRPSVNANEHESNKPTPLHRWRGTTLCCEIQVRHRNASGMETYSFVSLA